MLWSPAVVQLLTGRDLVMLDFGPLFSISATCRSLVQPALEKWMMDTQTLHACLLQGRGGREGGVSLISFVQRASSGAGLAVVRK